MSFCDVDQERTHKSERDPKRQPRAACGKRQASQFPWEIWSVLHVVWSKISRIGKLRVFFLGLVVGDRFEQNTHSCTVCLICNHCKALILSLCLVCNLQSKVSRSTLIQKKATRYNMLLVHTTYVIIEETKSSLIIKYLLYLTQTT